MTLTLELPEEIAAWLAELWPEERERKRFCVNAIGEALLLRENDNNARSPSVDQALDSVNVEKAA